MMNNEKKTPGLIFVTNGARVWETYTEGIFELKVFGEKPKYIRGETKALNAARAASKNFRNSSV